MELLLLWQWSTSAQVASALLIAFFFAAVSRSTGRHDLDWWLGAWLANLLALGVTMVFWFGEPRGPIAVLMGVSYLFTKTAFLLLLLIGAISLARGVAAGWIELRWLLLVAAYALPGGFLLDTVNKGGRCPVEPDLRDDGGSGAGLPARQASRTWLASSLSDVARMFHESRAPSREFMKHAG